MKTLIFTISILFFATTMVAQTASLSGKVTDAETKEEILFGSVALYQNGKLITGTETDFDGNYNFKELEPGVYQVEVSYIGYPTYKIEEVKVKPNRNNILNVELPEGHIDVCGPFCGGYVVPLIEMDNTTSGLIITSEQIRIWRK